MKDKILYIYYFALILALALYTNLNASPNIIIRLGYLAALVIPLVNRLELFPAIIICTLGISKSTFAYPLMPTDMAYYVILTVCSALFALYRRDFHTGVNPLFYIALLYIGVNDIAMQGELSQMAIVFFICILFFMCVEDDIDVVRHILPLSFILISLTISYWVMFCPEAQINNYNKAGDVQQTGWTDPNYLSAVLGMGLVVAVKKLINGGNRLFFIPVLGLTVLGSSISLLILASRGAILSVIVATTASFVLSKTGIKAKIIAIIVAVFFVFFLYNNQYMDFVMARFEADDGTGAHRTEIWQSKLNDFFLIDNPFYWMFGVGQSEGIKLGDYFGASVSGVSTHNDIISVLIYYGLIGISIFFCVIAYPLRICSNEDRPQILALMLYPLMCSMTIEPLAHGNFVYWGFLFYIIVLARNSQELELIDEEGEEIETEFDADGQE